MRALSMDLSAVGCSSYPEGVVADVIEQQIARSLPLIEGLEGATTQEQRLSMYGAAISQQRTAFIAMHGDPFGCDGSGESCEELWAPSAPAHFLAVS